ncbi:MAG: DNA ligase D [Burkholderiaceae bacterium]
MANRPDARLRRYHAKRDFGITPEPAGAAAPKRGRAAPLQYVVQKHWASRLHYDFRLELGGVMLSWAVPKGPSFDPRVKRLAVHVEDHPVSYNRFEGTIPKGQYGGGTVVVWDRGTWEPIGDPDQALARGKLVFRLHGQKLAGLWELVRTGSAGQRTQEPWLLLKKRGDAWARPAADYDVITALPDSVVEHPLGLLEAREPRERGAGAPDAPDLSAAVKAPLPATFEPQLATLASAAPADAGWLAEAKYDGYRLLARVSRGRAQLFTRNGNDWTDKLGGLARAVADLGLGSAWLDGEIAVLDEHGVPDFNRLQNAIDKAANDEIVYYLFDLPFLGGRDLRRVPLRSRRAMLEALLAGRASPSVRLSQTFDAAPASLLSAACRLGLEGVMLKRADAPYVSGRTQTWLKLKCQHRQEFVVVGFTDRANAPGQVGNLMLAYHDQGRLRYAGAVGTGWDTATGRRLHQQLSALEVKSPPIDPAPARPGRWVRGAARPPRWVAPRMVVEVAFGEWTPDGSVRHASFRGVRTDKPARSIRREQATAPTTPPPVVPVAPAAPAGASAKVHITHPDRVVDARSGATKIDLVRYYESVAPWLLRHLRGRPVSLVRAPRGIGQPLFFQKHAEAAMPGLTVLDPALWPGHEALLAVDSVEALVSAAQFNVIEFHTWNAKARRIDHPDRVVFDLDPGEGVTWAQLQEAAVLTRGLLTELGLASWLKTSGGKGLHVVVPIAPRHGDALVKAVARAVVQHMAQTIPQRFVAKSGPANRVGRIFVDYLRNGQGQTTVAAFSARARPGLGVSMPVSWEQLPELRGSAEWTVATAREYLTFQREDPWARYWTSRQTLARAIRRLGLDAAGEKPAT